MQLGSVFREVVWGEYAVMESDKLEHCADIISAWTPNTLSALSLEILQVQIFCSHVRKVPLQLSGCSHGSKTSPLNIRIREHQMPSLLLPTYLFIFLRLFLVFQLEFLYRIVSLSNIYHK